MMAEKPTRIFILIACGCAIFWPGAFIFGFPGVMRQYWQQAFNVGGSGVGQTIFFILAGATCFMYLCGRWQEKYGPGKLAALGAVLCGSSVIWLGRTDSMTAVYVWAFLVGTSSAFIYAPALTVVQCWYPERRGLVSGFFNMAFGLPAAIMSPVFTALLSKWGYETINLVLGSVALIVALAASTLIRFPQGHQSAPTTDTPSEPTSRSVSEALRSSDFWCLWLTWVLAGAAGASMLVLATGFGLARGLSLAQAVVLLTAFNLTNGSGRLVSGFFIRPLGSQPHYGAQFCGGGRRLFGHAPSSRHLVVGLFSGRNRFCLWNPVCGYRTAGRRLLRHGPFRRHLRADFHRLRVFVRAAGSVVERLYSGSHPGQLHHRLYLSGSHVSG